MHMEKLKICAVKTCNLPNEGGFDTCSTPSHRQSELDHHAQGRAMPRLKASARRAGGVTMEDEAVVPESPEPQGSRVTVKLTRTWTHNEQLFVRCCGLIVSRATLYGSESISSVKVREQFPPQ